MSADMAKLPQRERIIQHIQDRYAAEPEHLWARYPNYAVFRQPASRKWFAAVMDVAKKSLDMIGDGTADVMDVRCGPVLVGSLLAQDGFLPAYHMSKSSWISVLLDETVPDEQIFPLIELSYDSVAPKRKKS
ncbi:MAG: MmcQ/YjbR family DNA-binding protein [Oscillospiraceae bacterium]|nr:MmcQ/YjbR family DNA-binding protein [Oscillospiraceae bacterium]